MSLYVMHRTYPPLLACAFKMPLFFTSAGFTSNEIRKTFFDFFISNGHSFVPSVSVIPTPDKKIDFVYAGIQQFMDVIKNETQPIAPRIVNSQKCLRLGGRYISDIDLVGKDGYHHSFFEMLGNWSFGDYFKTEICTWAWQFLTDCLHIPSERLYVSYFGGDSTNDLLPDEECRQIWLDIGVSKEHVLPFGMKDNFWEMGGTGPCGPCSEIHYDRIGGRDASGLVNADDPMVVEIWNLVFIQYHRDKNDALKQLPSKYIDGGMGFERLVSVVQQKNTNYDTDLFTPIFDSIQKYSVRKHQYQGRFGEQDSDGIDTAYRIVSDHMRAVTVALADGLCFSDKKRRKNTRKIKELFKRATLYGHERLGMGRMSMHLLVPIIVQQLGETYPEIEKSKHRIVDAVRVEEERLWRQRDEGIRHLEEMFRSQPPVSKVFPGKLAFIIVQNYRVELEFVKREASLRGLTVDETEYRRLHVQKTTGSGLKIKEMTLKY